MLVLTCFYAFSAPRVTTSCRLNLVAWGGHSWPSRGANCQGLQQRARPRSYHSPGEGGRRDKNHHTVTPRHPHLLVSMPRPWLRAGPDAQASPTHHQQLQPRPDTANMYKYLNKCIIPAHMPSWQPAVAFACCYPSSEINVTAWDRLLPIFITKPIHLAGGGQKLSLGENKIPGQLTGNDREQISAGLTLALKATNGMRSEITGLNCPSN